MESVEELCDNIALINKSHLVVTGGTDDVRREYGSNQVEVLYRSGEALPQGTAYSIFSDNILRNTIDMISHEGEVGYSTNGYKVIEWLINENRVMDKVMLFTDCELWDSYNGGKHLAKSWEMYKKIAPDAKLYLFNLAGYGTSPVSMKRNDVFCISGWSDKVFDILAALERGNSAIDEIRRIVV